MVHGSNGSSWFGSYSILSKLTTFFGYTEELSEASSAKPNQENHRGSQNFPFAPFSIYPLTRFKGERLGPLLPPWGKVGKGVEGKRGCLFIILNL
jgi:hypothetical protein